MTSEWPLMYCRWTLVGYSGKGEGEGTYFGDGGDDDVCTEGEWVLVVGRRERVVDYERDLEFLCECRKKSDGNEVQQRVRRRFRPDQLRYLISIVLEGE
jgi:hypothetical protein